MGKLYDVNWNKEHQVWHFVYSDQKRMTRCFSLSRLGFASSYGFLEFESSSDAEVNLLLQRFWWNMFEPIDFNFGLSTKACLLYSRIASSIPEISFRTRAHLHSYQNFLSLTMINASHIPVYTYIHAFIRIRIRSKVAMSFRWSAVHIPILRGFCNPLNEKVRWVYGGQQHNVLIIRGSSLIDWVSFSD